MADLHRTQPAALTAIWLLGSKERNVVMLDIVFVVLTLVFFILAAAYVSACDRIK